MSRWHNDRTGNWTFQAFTLFWGGVVGLLVATIVVLLFALPAYNRYQKRANAQNEVSVNHIVIQQQAQNVLIAKQQAQIRVQNAVGLREAQDEIRKTLTPLYVQFEMVQALQAIATSGTNNTVIYLPTDPKSGLPVVPTSNSVAHGRRRQVMWTVFSWHDGTLEVGWLAGFLLILVTVAFVVALLANAGSDTDEPAE